MNKIQSFENFLNESLRPDELESQVRDITFLFRQHNRGVKGKHSDNQIVDFMKKYGWIQKLTSKQKDEVLDIVKKILNESSINEAARSNEALKYVTSKYKDDRVNSVTFDELLVPLANHLDDYADRMMGDLEYSKKTFAAFKSLVDLMTADHIESDKYN